MSLLSNLLKSAAKAVDEIEKSMPDDVKKNIGSIIENISEQAKKAEAEGKQAQPEAEPTYETGGEGTGTAYWGYVKPALENQYSYNGTYVEYFKYVFAENFPEYQIDCELPSDRNAAIFTFLQDGQTKLVVEVVGKNSKAKAIRRNCRNAGIPYLRFYHNVYGWWNVKEYVVNRVKSVL